MKYPTKTALCIDNGLFLEMAVVLSRDFGKVYYWTPWVSAFPKSNAMIIGKGVPGITRIQEFWSILDEIDVFVFCDVYEGALQEYLVSLGKRVWGGRMGEDLELDRVASKTHLASLGIPIGPYKVVIGMDALREYLKANDRQWVKVSASRGDFESFFAKDYRLIEPLLDMLEHNLGAKKKVMQFVVEEDIPDATEIGYDGFCIDGKFPKQAMWGIEVKDEGLVMQGAKYSALPPQVIDVNDKTSPTLKKLEYRGFISSEIRVTKEGIGYAIDPCARMGSPPGELYQVMVDNWAEIIFEGAMGVLVEPHLIGKWGAELMLLSSFADANWLAIEFPKSIRDNVKLRNLTIIDGKYYAVPQSVGLPEVGAVVAVGDSPEAAIKECKRLAEKVEAHYLKTVPDCLDKAYSDMKELEAKTEKETT